MLFRCLRSGNTVNIEQLDDIERMKDHEGYVPVIDYAPVTIAENDHEKSPDENAHETVQDAKEKEVLTVTLKKPGRPKKK